MQAAEILCPDAVVPYRQGGEALDAAIAKDLHRLRKQAVRDPNTRSDAWLTLQLLDAIRRRPDLQLTGRNRFSHLAPRAPMEFDVLQAACERDNGDETIGRRWVLISFRTDHLSSSRDYPPTYLDDTIPANWADVRIEAASETATPAYALGAGHEVKMTYNPARCRAWHLLRIDGWSKDRPPPNRDDCYAAACAYFAGPIDRTEFRKIRNAMVPASWKARGRRSATKTEAR
jgi:hypothetical protein